MNTQPKEIEYYQTQEGDCPFRDWFAALKDRMAQMRIDARLARLRGGNPGDVKAVGGGVSELRVDYGPGYRVYIAMADNTLVVLLCGGDKRTQAADIKQAKKFWADYQQRPSESEDRNDED
ncbi:MAG TPA: type II toxin-antitoxin system RelE/ParE family toxin [Blastocatellia bacterium]|nr:type II toxin-antitoxin system RelE/ParE family toxin [Blastocatellia bacterium]HNG31607.1 type II toxin-antitoxin system RelE/ParE family toxin [Blastocatellia bacterium]